MERTSLSRATALVAALTLSLAATASAHIERASYWPNPKVDKAGGMPTGGKVPHAKSLASAVAKGQKGTTRVVCQSDSLSLLNTAIADALKNGYDIRPTDHRKFTKGQANKLRIVNKKLFKRCTFHEIQPAVNASHNNDRVVIMPGLYTEPTSRSAPTNDPACADLRILNDRGQPEALSYAYQLKCPNDQNLIAVMGRALGPGKDPEQPRPDRHGIPNLGKCIRCNLQMEGSGVSADDVVIDGGRVESGNGGPIEPKKDVGIRVDRADGFVLRNVTVRHVREHSIYILEQDGYLLDRFKVYYSGEYGVLTFVEDHGLMRNCDAAGFGDSALYPGAAAETGDQGVKEGFEKKRRYNQRITRCDMRHSTLGYSGTDANGVRVDHNNFYDNTMGFSTDIFTASGHPGYPQDSDLVEHNNFYGNNFNSYAEDSDVEPTVPVPVGVGMWIAGGNANIIRKNRFFDNWRRGTMLFTVPDQFVCPESDQNNLKGCDPTTPTPTTSYDNSYYENTMGVALDGSYVPNGTDFWWDQYATSTGNCWFKNTPFKGKEITTSSALPDCDGGKNPESSRGQGDPAAQGELIQCLVAIEQDNRDACPWFSTPPKPDAG
jgi:hypothetical protein